MMVNASLIDLLKRMNTGEVVDNMTALGMRKQYPNMPPEKYEEVCLAGAHKARVFLGKPFTDAELAASREWLTARGYGANIL
jgi:hypothetical protein